MKYAVRVYFGSSEPEYTLFGGSGEYVGFWASYHDGTLPDDVKIVTPSFIEELRKEKQ